jgi:sugar porter (SP) family MFS transporter
MTYIFPVTVVAVTALCLGYDAGVMSGAIMPMVKDFNLTELEEGLVIGCVNLVAAFGALMGGRLADWKGRVPATMICSAVLAVGPAVVATAGGFVQLFLGRIIIGVGVGLCFVISPVYGCEMAPVHVRAIIISVTEILINLGIILGYLSAELLELPAFQGSFGWRFVTGLAAAPAVMIICCYPLLPESPRWLVQAGRHEEAEKVLLKSRGSKEEVSLELTAIEEAIADDAKEVGWSKIFCPTPQVFRMLLAGIGCAFFQQASGNEAIVYYTPTVLKDLGMTSESDQNHGAMAVGFAKFLGSIAGAFFLDIAGRRPGVIVSATGMAVCMGCLAVMENFKESTPLALGLGLLCANMFVFELGLAPAACVLGTECYPMEIRGKALSCGMFTTRFVSGTVAILFPGAQRVLGAETCFWILFGVAVLGIVWSMLCVPETKGVPLEEVVNLFEEPLSCCPAADSESDSDDSSDDVL